MDHATITTTYPNLTPYARPRDFADFADFDRAEYYLIPGLGHHRDSDTLDPMRALAE